jgi:CRP-like cAMP-binding protein
MKHIAAENRLLAILPARSQQSFLGDCERVTLAFADVLCAAGDPIRHVYFPIDSFVSLVTALADDTRLEVGMIGSEGMLGTSLILGVGTQPQYALVQGAGAALRMNASDFANHCRASPVLRQGLNRYIYVLTSQLAMTAACIHYHVVEERLARWLLMTRDRAHSDRFRLTHKFLSYMLGVRRVGVTEAASSLHARGLIQYNRGEIAILDVAGLEDASCRCYGQGNEIYERIMGVRRGAARR